MLRRLSWLVALLVCFGTSATAVSGCTSNPGSGPPPRGQVCTEIGCGPNLKVILPEASEAQGQVTLRHCLDGKCEEMTFASQSEMPSSFDLMAARETTSLSVEVRDSNRVLAHLPETELTLKAIRPNGPNCEPVCYSGEARVPAV